jgi:hypothetical protein
LSTTAVLAAGVAVVVALPLAHRIARRRLDVFEPVVIFALAWGVMFAVRPIATVIRDDVSFYGVDIRPTLDNAVLLGLLGAVSFLIGYELQLGMRLARRLPRPSEREISSSTIAGAWIAGGLGMVALALFLLPADGWSAVGIFLRGRSVGLNDLLRDSPDYFWWLSLLVVPAAILAFAVAYSTRRNAAIAAAVVLTGFALLRTVPVGSRLYLLVLVGGMVVFPYLRARRRPGVVAFAVGLAVALVVSYAVLQFRTPETRSGFVGVLDSLISAPTQVLQPVVDGPDAEMAPALAGALSVIPSDLGYRYGAATIGDLVLRPIPRQLWSRKPQPHDLVVTERVWPEARASGNFQPTYTPLLSFYWDLGLIGVFLGMAAYGVLARSAYEYFRRAEDSFGVQVVYAAGLWAFVFVLRADPVLAFSHLVIVLVPLIAIVALGNRPRHVRAAARTRPTSRT